MCLCYCRVHSGKLYKQARGHSYKEKYMDTSHTYMQNRLFTKLSDKRRLNSCYSRYVHISSMVCTLIEDNINFQQSPLQWINWMQGFINLGSNTTPESLFNQIIVWDLIQTLWKQETTLKWKGRRETS